MYRRLLVLFIALFLLVPSVHAQASPDLETLVIDLWPEYDQPSMLVIYKAVISPDVSLPAEIKFSIPVAAGAPSAVAVGPDASSVADVVYDTQVMGEWLEVSFIATTPSIQFEYYDPGLVKDGVLRRFEYVWPGDHAVNSLDLRVQHPLGATDLSIKPVLGRVIAESDGFQYTEIDVGPLNQDAHFDIGISYTKESDALSIESLQIQPSATIAPVSRSLRDLGQLWWVWLLVVLAVVLIAGGAYWYWRLGREEVPSKKKRRRRVPNTQAEEIFREGAVYCHQCGKRAESGDRYCRSCGSRLRIE